MIDTTDDNHLIKSEIYFEHHQIADDSKDKFAKLLLEIQAMLENGEPLKKIKKRIRDFEVHNDLDENLKKMLDEQMQIITDDENKTISLQKEALAGYTFAEAIRERKKATQKQAQRFMAQAKELIKENKSLKELYQNEVKKFTKQMESFYRTQTKKAREYGYAEVEKKYEIKGWISIAVLDNRTSAICMALHNKFYPKERYKSRLDVPNPPPRHPNCRSILVAVKKGKSIQSY